MQNSTIKSALDKYLKIKMVMDNKDKANADSNLDPLDFGWGHSEEINQQLHEARSEFCEAISPEYIADTLSQLSHLRGEMGSLILENMVLKSELRKRGVNPELIGNVSEGEGIQ